jgi:large subunit ribosomal protein L9
MASTIQVILQQDLKNVGKSGELVKVKPGYARNYLIPRRLAVPATVRNISQIEHEQRVTAARAAKLRAEAGTVAEKLAAVTVTIARKVGEEGKIFGSVTTKDIAEALAAKDVQVDRKKIVIKDPIRSTGTFNVDVKLGGDVDATVKVEVVSQEK